MRRLFIPVFAILIALTMTSPALAATTFTVNSLDDANDGSCNATHCSLREAINAANTSTTQDVIAFNIAGTPPFTIAPTMPLPAITKPVIINGATQPGFISDPVIILDGSNLTPLAIPLETKIGLNLVGINSTVRGLVINRFDHAGIRLGGPGGGHVIETNLIGTDTGEGTGLANGYGLLIENSANNFIERNEIFGNLNDGVRIAGITASNNRLQYNSIGNQYDAASGNGGNGVIIENAPDNSLMSNDINRNGHHGIVVRGANAVRNRMSILYLRNNGQLGISLDDGGNAHQPAPHIEVAWEDEAYNIVGSLTARPNITYRIEFYITETCEVTGTDELYGWTGSANVTTNAAKIANFQITTSDLFLYPGAGIAAIAIAPDGSTSALSECQLWAGEQPVEYAAPHLNVARESYGYVTLTWQELPRAAEYEFEVDFEPAFTSGYNTYRTSETTFTPPTMFRENVYYWRVRAIDAAGKAGAWSEVQTFTVVQPTPTP